MRDQYERSGGKPAFLDNYLRKRLIVQEAANASLRVRRSISRLSSARRRIAAKMVRFASRKKSAVSIVLIIANVERSRIFPNALSAFCLRSSRSARLWRCSGMPSASEAM